MSSLMMVIGPATNWPHAGVLNCAAHRCALVLHRRQSRPCPRRGAAAISCAGRRGQRSTGTRLSKGLLLFRDDALAAWLAGAGYAPGWVNERTSRRRDVGVKRAVR